MTGKNIRFLAMVVAALVLVVLLLNKNHQGGPASPARPLLPEFAEQANDAQHISVVSADNDPLTIRRNADRWVVANRDDYPADIAKLRQIFVALASAKILEEKTSNPDLYEKLEIDDPQEGGSGTRITIDGDGFSFSLIVGKLVQSEHRYVRIAGMKPGYLIDQNPGIPQNISGWLLPEIMDIDAKRVRKLTIRHENGETIILDKSAEDMTDFTVLDVPQGRELSYATVGNSIAGALGNLSLDDVRAATAATPSSSAVIQTSDGLQITVTISTDDQSSWLTFGAAAIPLEQTSNATDDSSSANADRAAVDDEITLLNERLHGWQFRITEYKKDLLTKHWEDILKSRENSSP